MNSKNWILVVCVALYLSFIPVEIWVVATRGTTSDGKTARVSAVAAPLAVRKVVVVPGVIQPVAKAPISIRPVDENGVYHVDSGYETFTVCVNKLAVKNNPGDEFPILRYLHEGDQVTIYERSKGVLGWAMIDPAVWVKEDGLCR